MWISIYFPTEIKSLSSSTMPSSALVLNMHYDSAATYKAKSYDDCYFVNL